LAPEDPEIFLCLIEDGSNAKGVTNIGDSKPIVSGVGRFDFGIESPGTLLLDPSI
jgi:hypothetical protein